jgi:hypothetical protein
MQFKARALSFTFRVTDLSLLTLSFFVTVHEALAKFQHTGCRGLARKPSFAYNQAHSLLAGPVLVKSPSHPHARPKLPINDHCGIVKISLSWLFFSQTPEVSLAFLNKRYYIC